MNKYNAKKTGDFHSKKERDRYCYLFAEQLEGRISELERQVPFVLIEPQDGKTRHERAVKYIADFTYLKDGEYIVEDVKGYRGGEAYSLFVVKRKLMLQVHGIEVKEV